MQQATSLTGDLAPTSGNVLPAGNPQASFVINLCASTTPVGLVHPSHPQLKRFTFFVSRRREEGRERFRLHMGYFSSQEEAEKLLDAVRDIYPAAWAGVAPGQNLRSRTPTAPASDVAARAPVQAPAAAAKPPAPAAATSAATTVPTAAATTATVAAAAAPAAAAPAATPVVSRAEETATHSLSNVRAAIDSLRDEPAAPVAARPAPVVPTAPATTAEPQALQGVQVLSLLEDAPAARPVAAAPSAPARAVPAKVEPSKPVAAPTPLRAVPQLRAVPAARPANPVSAAPPRPATPAAAPRASRAPAATPAATPELAAYAVQLLWSVQPIDMTQVPQLAIFAAYKLYGAEGNRDGRRWYGLRLGFFTDAVSAKQVAQYVRSEFKSVSVVPVTQRERERASAATARPLPATTASKSTGHELNFIEEIPTDTAMSGSRPALQVQPDGAPVRPRDAAAAAGMPSIDALISELAHNERAGSARPPERAPSARAPTGKRAKLRVAQGTKPVSKRPQHDGPLTLEETLEILGASTLQLDNGRGELLNDAANGNRKSNAGKSQRGSRFGRLIDRLADRFSGS